MHLSHPPALWLGDLALAMQCWLETLGRGAQAFVFLSTGLEEASLMLEGGSKRCQDREMEELSCLCFLREKWHLLITVVQFSSVQWLSRVRLFATPRIAARQASLSITNSRSSLRLTFIESVTPSSHLILSRPLLLLPPIPPSIRVFSNESTLRMRWPKY